MPTTITQLLYFSYSAWFKRKDTTFSYRSSTEHSGNYEVLLGCGLQSDGAKPLEQVMIFNKAGDFDNSQRHYRFDDGNANEGDIGWHIQSDVEYGVV
jgi:hypothetical protein